MFDWFEVWLLSNFFLKELETLKTELEESIDTTTAAQDMRNKRESELAALKRSVEEETAAHEAAMGQLRQKHAQLVEELNVQLETTKKVPRFQNRWDVWRQVTMVAKCLDLNNLCSERRPFALIVERWKKVSVRATVMFLSAVMQRKVIHVHFSL